MTTPDRFFIVEHREFGESREIWIEGEIMPAYIGPEEAAGISEYGADPFEVSRNSTARSPRGELMTLEELLDTAGGERALAECARRGSLTSRLGAPRPLH
jgi:hypothetical protein